MDENQTHTSGAGQATPPPPPPPPHTGAPAASATPEGSGPRVSWDEMRDVRRLSRPVHDRKVAGVAAGLARHFDVDPLLVRVTLVVLVFFGGAGLLIYGALWLLLPEDSGERAPVALDDRSRQFAVIGVGVLAALTVLGAAWGDWPFPWPLLLLALLVLLVVSRQNTKREQAAAQSWSSPQPWSPPQGWQAAQGWQPPQPGGNATAPPSAPPSAPAEAPEYAAPVGGSTSEPTPEPTPGHGPGAYGAGAYGAGAYGAGPGTAPTPATTPPPFGNGAMPPVPPAYPVPAQPRPVDPRKRGPILFGATLALLALAMGVLGTVDLAGVDVTPSAYPATALGVIAAALLLGSFWGRAGGLIALGLVAACATASTMAVEEWHGERVDIRLAPVVAADVPDSSRFRTGEFVLDLSRITDLEALDGRVLAVEGGVGRIEVVVPHGLGVTTDAEVGVGDIQLLDGSSRGGLGVSRSGESHGGEDVVATVQLELELGVGEVAVVRPEDGSHTPPGADSAVTPAPSTAPSTSPSTPPTTPLDEGAVR